MDNVTKLYVGDQRAAALSAAVYELIHERGMDMPLPTVLGVLDIIKHILIDEYTD